MGYDKYKEQTVMTMTQGELLIVLYDELLKRLKRAELALENEKFQVFDESVERCTEIVRYLKDTLNYDYQVSGDLYRMYDFFLYQLSRIKAGRQPELITELAELVRELRDTFAEAATKAGQ